MVVVENYEFHPSMRKLETMATSLSDVLYYRNQVAEN